MQSFNAQTQDWVSLSQELNGDVLDMVVYQGKLIACGTFTVSEPTVLRNIAAWDGIQWTNLGKGIKSNNVNSIAVVHRMLIFNNELYAVGRFDSAGTIASKNVAKWDGTNWISLTNFVNNQILSITAYNNEVYIGGRFDAMETISPSRIAKYDGNNWQSIGSGISSLGDFVRDFYSFNSQLYMSGSFPGAGGINTNNVAIWDGTSWHGITNNTIGGTAMIEWNGKLLFSNTNTVIQDIQQWDGINWSMFSSQHNMCYINKFYIFNNKLYCAGYNIPPGSDDNSVIYSWDQGSQIWSKVGTGVNGTVLGLCEYNGELYCSGVFKKSTGANHNYIAKLSTVTGLAKSAPSKVSVNVFPNPVKDKLNLEFAGNETGDLSLSMINALGQTVLNSKIEIHNFNSILDLSCLQSGVYYLKIENDKTNRVLKLIKE